MILEGAVNQVGPDVDGADMGRNILVSNSSIKLKNLRN